MENENKQVDTGNSQETENYVITGKSKICKQCGTKIDATMRVCPKCFKRQPNTKQNILIAIAIVAVICIVGAIGSSIPPSSSTPDSDKKSTETSSNSSTDTKDKIYKVGETAENDGVKIVVKEAKESKGNEWGKPSKGMKLVFVKFLFDNKSDEEITVSSFVSFEAYCDDSKIDMSSEAFLSAATSKMKQLDGSVAAGKKLEGWIGYEIPKKAKKLEVYYSDNFLESGKIKFSVLN